MAADGAEAKIKAAGNDKAFIEKTKKLKAGTLAEAQAEKVMSEAAIKAAMAETQTATNLIVTQETSVVTAKKQLAALGTQLADTIPGHPSGVWAIAFSPDGKQLVSGSHRVGSESNTDTIKVWDLATKTSLFSPPAKKKDEKSNEEK